MVFGQLSGDLARLAVVKPSRVWTCTVESGVEEGESLADLRGVKVA